MPPTSEKSIHICHTLSSAVCCVSSVDPETKTASSEKKPLHTLTKTQVYLSPDSGTDAIKVFITR